jgi:hypothetical protein
VVIDVNEFREGEQASSIGEHPKNIDDADEHRNRILAHARDILARQPTAAEIEEDEARRQRNASDHGATLGQLAHG